MGIATKGFDKVIEGAQKSAQLNGRKRLDDTHRRLDAALLKKGVAPLKRELASVPKARFQRDINELLWIAAYRNKCDVIPFLIDQGAQIGYKGSAFLTFPTDALAIAVERKNDEAVALLAPHCEALPKGPYLHEAIERSCSIKTIRLLIKLGANVNFRDGHWGSPLNHACRKANKSACLALLDAGAEVNTPTAWGTPLEALLRFRSLTKIREREIARVLLERGSKSPELSEIEADVCAIYTVIVAGHLAKQTVEVDDKTLPSGLCQSCGRPAHNGRCRL